MDLAGGKVEVRGGKNDKAGGLERRHHVHEVRVGRALGAAVKAAGLDKKVTAHTLVHSFATHLVLRGVDVRSVQELPGHADWASVRAEGGDKTFNPASERTNRPVFAVEHRPGFASPGHWSG